MPMWMALSFQDNISPSMEHILFFHDHAMIILTLITILTFYILTSMMMTSKFNKYIMEGQEIETIWTVLPSAMLIFIALPSLKTLYLMEDTKNPSVTIKISGHQWYWSYEYTNLGMVETDNFMANSMTMRLMKTSELTHLPVNSSIRAMITSMDVIHSWTIPTMGVKVDALPGRLNQIFLMSKRVGLFTGQCSEICGANHSFMPILINMVSTKKFIEKMSSL